MRPGPGLASAARPAESMLATSESSQERAVGTALQHLDKSAAVPNYMKLRRLDHSGVRMMGAVRGVSARAAVLKVQRILAA